MSDPRPIGIFDSGIGGLTVLSAIRRALPEESLIYLGDTARVPYGIRSAETIVQYSKECCAFLAQKNVKAIVIACNTASSYAFPKMAENFPFPILGVVGPGVKAVLESNGSGPIGVIGTTATIASHVYQKLIQYKKPETTIVEIACPLFVPLVEEGWTEGEVTEKVIRQYLEPFLQQSIQRVVLACTHYPLLKKSLQKVLGSNVVLIDSAEEVARNLKEILSEKGLLHSGGDQSSVQIFVTDIPQKFKEIAARFLDFPVPPVQKISW